jgi:predicted phosphodiesterase
MRGATITNRLLAIYKRAPEITISDTDRLVIFSDVHMGDGGKQDDFLRNGPMFRTVLERYYEQRGFGLILNGDVEELQRFYQGPIHDKWVDIYEILGRFKERDALYKLAGNHDLELLVKKRNPLDIPIHEAIRLVYKESDIFLLHGHQAYRYMKAFILLSGLLLRFVANPLGIKNYSVAFDSRKKYRVERRVYRFAKSRKVLAVIGHTHRPLFESLSRLDRLKFHIERLCRLYPQAAPDEQDRLEKRILESKAELQSLVSKKHNRGIEWRGSLYQTEPVVPCLFNSGCCIGKSGMTALEIEGGRMALIHWFDRRVRDKYLKSGDHTCCQLEKTEYHRVPLKDENLDYLFTRVRLLS